MQVKKWITVTYFANSSFMGLNLARKGEGKGAEKKKAVKTTYPLLNPSIGNPRGNKDKAT